jgi:regulator of RNase E activity RraB
MGIRAYGIADNSDTLKESKEAREIVKAIMDHGVTQNQIYYIIHDLALNLDDRENMKRSVDLVKEMMDGTVLISTEDSILEV